MRVATVGNPNVGKSSLINALAGSDLQVGNWPGTTVDRLAVRFELDGTSIDWVDLPGTYTLAGATSEERITRHELLNHPPDVVVNVLDAGNLERNLGLTLELAELGLPMVVVLNLIDEARSHGIVVDAAKLSERLGVDVVETVASRGQGAEQVKKALLQARKPTTQTTYPPFLAEAIDKSGITPTWKAVTMLSEEVEGIVVTPALEQLRRDIGQVQDPFLAVMEARLSSVQSLAHSSQVQEEVGKTLTQKIDSWVLHPILGFPLFLLGMLGVFRFTYLFSDPWINYLDVIKGVLSGWIASWHLTPWLQSFLVSGVLDGAGTVAAFSPVLFLLYLAMAFLEASGLLARTAFLFDRGMKALALPGRSLIPLLLGFGCNVPAIYSTRILPHASDRIRVALAIPFMACSARLTVFVLFGAVFFGKQAPYVVLALYLLGLLLGLVTAWLTLSFVPKESDRTGVMELPPYRFPSWQAVLRQAWLRTRAFLKNAAGLILGSVIVIWFLHQVPGGPVENSLYARVSQALTVPLRPLGIEDWRLTGALIPGFIAKEVVIGTLGVSFLGEEPVAVVGAAEGLKQLGVGFGQALKDTALAVPQWFGVPSAELPTDETSSDLRAALAKACSAPAAAAYLVFLLLYTPCVATVAAIAQEFGRRWAVGLVIWEMAVAWVAGWLTYVILR